MQKFAVGFIIGLVALTPFAAAHESSIKAEDLQSLADKYNSDLDKVPGIIKTVTGSERANLHISYPDGDEDIIGLVMKDGKVESIADGPVENPTLNIYTNNKVVDNILNSKEPFVELGKAVARKEINFSGVDTISKIKFWFLKILLSILLPAPTENRTQQTADYSIEIRKEGSAASAGFVTSDPSGISCGERCNAAFPRETTVTLSAVSTSRAYFLGWTGGPCSGSRLNCTVTLDTSKIITSTFSSTPPQNYLLTVTKSGRGSGTVRSQPISGIPDTVNISCGSICSASYPPRRNFGLVAEPSPGSTFVGWEGDCSSSYASPERGSCMIDTNSEKLVTAIFSPPASAYRLIVEMLGSGRGTITSAPAGISCPPTCSNNFDYGTNVTLSVAPASGSRFVHWDSNVSYYYDTKDCSGIGPCTVNMTSDKNVQAILTSSTAQNYTLTIRVFGSGRGWVSYPNPYTRYGGSSTTCMSWYSGSTQGDPTASIGPTSTSMTCDEGGRVQSPIPHYGSRYFIPETRIHLSARADNNLPYNDFGGWMRGCDPSSIYPDCQVTLGSSRVVDVNFSYSNITVYTLTATISGKGSILQMPSDSCIEESSDFKICTARVRKGARMELTAAPSSGQIFRTWSEHCSSFEGAQTCTIDMTSDKSVRAHFAPRP